MVASLSKALVRLARKWLRPRTKVRSLALGRNIIRNSDSPYEANLPRPGGIADAHFEYDSECPCGAAPPRDSGGLGHFTKKLIKGDEFHQAVNLLEEYAVKMKEPDISGDLVLLSSKLLNSDKEYYLGLISRKNYVLERSQQGRLLVHIHRQLFPSHWGDQCSNA